MGDVVHIAAFNNDDPEAWEDFLLDNKGVKPDLRGVKFERSYYKHCDLKDAALDESNSNSVFFRNCSFTMASLAKSSHAHNKLRDCFFNVTNLTAAKFYRCLFVRCHFIRCSMKNLDLSGSFFVNCTFSTNEYLETVTVDETYSQFGLVGDDLERERDGSSIPDRFSIDMETVLRSDLFPPGFMKASNFPDSIYREIMGKHRDNYRMPRCFISHSAKDKRFADKLHSDLMSHGVPCWYAPRDLEIGARIRDGIDSAVRQNEKLILILSKNSIASQWVESEMESALEVEKSRGNRTPMLVPISIDGFAMGCEIPWVRMVRRERNIGDFRGWRRDDGYLNSLQILLRDIRSTQKVGGPQFIDLARL